MQIYLNFAHNFS